MNSNILEKATGAHLSRNVTKELDNLFIIRGGCEKTSLLSALTRDLDAMRPFTSCQSVMSEKSKKQCKDQGSIHQRLCHPFFLFECRPSGAGLASSYPAAQSRGARVGVTSWFFSKQDQHWIALKIFSLIWPARHRLTGIQTGIRRQRDMSEDKPHSWWAQRRAADRTIWPSQTWLQLLEKPLDWSARIQGSETLPCDDSCCSGMTETWAYFGWTHMFQGFIQLVITACGKWKWELSLPRGNDKCDGEEDMLIQVKKKKIYCLTQVTPRHYCIKQHSNIIRSWISKR